MLFSKFAVEKREKDDEMWIYLFNLIKSYRRTARLLIFGKKSHKLLIFGEKIKFNLFILSINFD